MQIVILPTMNQMAMIIWVICNMLMVYGEWSSNCSNFSLMKQD